MVLPIKHEHDAIPPKPITMNHLTEGIFQKCGWMVDFEWSISVVTFVVVPKILVMDHVNYHWCWFDNELDTAILLSPYSLGQHNQDFVPPTRWCQEVKSPNIHTQLYVVMGECTLRWLTFWITMPFLQNALSLDTYNE